MPTLYLTGNLADTIFFAGRLVGALLFGLLSDRWDKIMFSKLVIKFKFASLTRAAAKQLLKYTKVNSVQKVHSAINY